MLKQKTCYITIKSNKQHYIVRKGDILTNNVYWHPHTVDRSTRSGIKNQRSCIIWFTGLSSSGKSSIANAIEIKLVKRLHHTYLLDGDNIRHSLCNDLGFSDSDRKENIRRVGEVASLMLNAGLIVLTAFISPFRSDRETVRKMVDDSRFIEVFVDTPITECEIRYTKGLYLKARNGDIKNFTGISSPYERPHKPELHVINHNISINTAAEQVINYLDQQGYLDRATPIELIDNMQ